MIHKQSIIHNTIGKLVEICRKWMSSDVKWCIHDDSKGKVSTPLTLNLLNSLNVFLWVSRSPPRS